MPKILKSLLLVLALVWAAGSVAAGGPTIYPEDEGDATETLVVPVLVGGLALGAAVVDE